MKIIVVTKNGTTIESKDLYEKEVTQDELNVYIAFAERAGNANMTGSITLPLYDYTPSSAIININNVDHVIFVDPLYQEVQDA